MFVYNRRLNDWKCDDDDDVCGLSGEITIEMCKYMPTQPIIKSKKKLIAATTIHTVELFNEHVAFVVLCNFQMKL